MNVLFICNQNKNRSRTAEELFSDRFETKSAGLYNTRPVTKRQLAWADVIVVMEDTQRQEIARRFPALGLAKRILSIGVSDSYYHGQPELIRLLRSRMDSLL